MRDNSRSENRKSECHYFTPENESFSRNLWLQSAKNQRHRRTEAFIPFATEYLAPSIACVRGPPVDSVFQLLTAAASTVASTLRDTARRLRRSSGAVEAFAIPNCDCGVWASRHQPAEFGQDAKLRLDRIDSFAKLLNLRCFH